MKGVGAVPRLAGMEAADLVKSHCSERQVLCRSFGEAEQILFGYREGMFPPPGMRVAGWYFENASKGAAKVLKDRLGFAA